MWQGCVWLEKHFKTQAHVFHYSGRKSAWGAQWSVTETVESKY